MRLGIRKKFSRLEICMCGFCHTRTLLPGIQMLVYPGFQLKTCGNDSFWGVNSACKNLPLRARCAFGGGLQCKPASIFGGGAGWKFAVHFFSQFLRRATPQERREKRLNIIVREALPVEEAPAARAGRPLFGGRSGHKPVINGGKREKKHNKLQSGFTLIELVLVIVFLGIAIIASMRAMSSSLTKSMDVEILMTATNLANEKLERILADKKSRGYDYVDQDNYTQEINVNGTNGYNRYVTITVYSTYKEVNVKVTHSGAEDYELTTFLTNY